MQWNILAVLFCTAVASVVPLKDMEQEDNALSILKESIAADSEQKKSVPSDSAAVAAASSATEDKRDASFQIVGASAYQPRIFRSTPVASKDGADPTAAVKQAAQQRLQRIREERASRAVAVPTKDTKETTPSSATADSNKNAGGCSSSAGGSARAANASAPQAAAPAVNRSALAAREMEAEHRRAVQEKEQLRSGQPSDGFLEDTNSTTFDTVAPEQSELTSKIASMAKTMDLLNAHEKMMKDATNTDKLTSVVDSVDSVMMEASDSVKGNHTHDSSSLKKTSTPLDIFGDKVLQGSDDAHTEINRLKEEGRYLAPHVANISQMAREDLVKPSHVVEELTTYDPSKDPEVQKVVKMKNIYQNGVTADPFVKKSVIDALKGKDALTSQEAAADSSSRAAESVASPIDKRSLHEAIQALKQQKDSQSPEIQKIKISLDERNTNFKAQMDRLESSKQGAASLASVLERTGKQLDQKLANTDAQDAQMVQKLQQKLGSSKSKSNKLVADITKQLEEKGEQARNKGFPQVYKHNLPKVNFDVPDLPQETKDLMEEKLVSMQQQLDQQKAALAQEKLNFKEEMEAKEAAQAPVTATGNNSMASAKTLTGGAPKTLNKLISVPLADNVVNNLQVRSKVVRVEDPVEVRVLDESESKAEEVISNLMAVASKPVEPRKEVFKAKTGLIRASTHPDDDIDDGSTADSLTAYQRNNSKLNNQSMLAQETQDVKEQEPLRKDVTVMNQQVSQLNKLLDESRGNGVHLLVDHERNMPRNDSTGPVEDTFDVLYPKMEPLHRLGPSFINRSWDISKLQMKHAPRVRQHVHKNQNPYFEQPNTTIPKLFNTVQNSVQQLLQMQKQHCPALETDNFLAFEKQCIHGHEASAAEKNESIYRQEEAGVYRCGCCGATLFRSEHLEQVKDGKEIFSHTMDHHSIQTRPDPVTKHVDIMCSKCHVHLGHVHFEDELAEQQPGIASRNSFAVNPKCLHFHSTTVQPKARTVTGWMTGAKMHLLSGN